MKDLPRILSTYAEVDAFFENELLSSTAASKVEAHQTLNDQAYFLMCWEQIEIEIDHRCRAAVRHRRADPDWRVRQAWDLYNPDEPRFSGLGFENRAELVLDMWEGSGKPYAMAMKHYGLRNEIAHGKLRSTRIDVGVFVQDCYLIQAALHRSA